MNVVPLTPTIGAEVSGVDLRDVNDQVFAELEDTAHDAYRDITLEDLFLCRAGIKAYTDAATEPAVLPRNGTAAASNNGLSRGHRQRSRTCCRHS